MWSVCFIYSDGFPSWGHVSIDGWRGRRLVARSWHTLVLSPHSGSIAQGCADAPTQRRKPMRACMARAFPHTVCGHGDCLRLTCLSLCVQFSNHNNCGFHGDDIGVDRFPSGKVKHLTFHIHSACSTSVPHRVTNQHTLSHINNLV